jgi:DNA helicase MCM8
LVSKFFCLYSKIFYPLFKGKFVSIRGTVVRVGNIKPMVSQMDFQCVRCGVIFTCYFQDGKFKNPIKCPGSNCKNKIFEPIYSTSRTADWQRIRIQEQVDKKDPGRVPRTVECELNEDLVDSCIPGDVVVICGVVKVQAPEQEKGRPKDKSKSLYLIYIDVNSLDNSKNMDNGKTDLVNFNEKELVAIHHISIEKNVFRLIVNSLCPGIFGHEIVKGSKITIF